MNCLQHPQFGNVQLKSVKQILVYCIFYMQSNHCLRQKQLLIIYFIKDYQENCDHQTDMKCAPTVYQKTDNTGLLNHMIQTLGENGITSIIQIILKCSAEQIKMSWIMWNSHLGQVKVYLLFYTVTNQESCHSINKDHSYMRIIRRQTFSKWDHNQCSIHEHSVSQMLRHSNRLWLLELHEAHPRCHRHRRITIEKIKHKTTLNNTKLQNNHLNDASLCSTFDKCKNEFSKLHMVLMIKKKCEHGRFMCLSRK